MTECKEIMNNSLSDKVPRHVAIITDGNGRWATRRGLPRSLGHKAGVEPIRDITEACADLGVKVLTWYAFSTENWKRDVEEVGYLMKLFVEFFRQWRDEIFEKGIRFHHIGSRNNLSEDLLREIKLTEEKTGKNEGMTINIALNYGGKDEIVNAARLIAKDVQDGKLAMEEITEEALEGYLYTAGQIEPDFFIRTSGELRLSNFLLWQLSKAQLWTTPVLWPDFTREMLLEAFKSYKRV